MRLSVHAEGPAIDLDRFVRAIPLLVGRARTVSFDDDDRAVLEGKPTDRLLLVDGTAGRPGAAYRVTGDDGEPTTVTVTRDDAEAIDAELSGGTGGQGNGVTTGTGTVTLERPAEAVRLVVAGALTVADAPRMVGSRWDLAGQALLADWDAPGEPQLAIQLSGRLGSANSTARIDRRSGGPGPLGDEADLWDIALEIELRPRNVARLAALAWPFVRRRVTEAIARQITAALVESAEQIAEDFDPEDGPEEIADRAWAIIVADLTTPVRT